MIIYNKKKKKKSGYGFVNKFINKLPIELHLPGYSYCGPGTKLTARLSRGDRPINGLDSACLEHDIAYSQNRENISARNAADKVLADKAWQRVFAKDSSIGEKAAAYAVTNTMNLKSKLGMGLKKRSKKIPKRKLGMGLKKKRSKKTSKKKSKKRSSKKMVSFNSVIRASSKTVTPGKSPKSLISATIKASRKAIKAAGGKRKIKFPRILPVSSKIGGFLPLIPLFAGLSATGALAGGAAGVYKALNQAKSARQELEESKRHNKTMEAIALGKGLYLKPYKTGLGLHLKPYSGASLKKKSSK